MNAPEPFQNSKLYYSIGEVAEILKVNPSLIRYWEKEFGNIRPRKNRRGSRLFTIREIDLLRYIYFLVKEQGHTLEGAKRIIKQKESEDNDKYSTIQTLQKIKALLIDLRNEA